MADQKYLKSLNKEDLLRYGVLSLKSGNFITTKDIDKLDKKIITKETLQAYDKDILFEVCKQSNLESIEFLKSKGFDLSARDQDGNTCLHHAAKWGNIQVLSLTFLKQSLLKKGFRKNIWMQTLSIRKMKRLFIFN
jgi:ankyrin repeat protein